MAAALKKQALIPGIEYFLCLVYLAVRVPVACCLELGNDEVYYLTYARYPDWSHFDHPPMVGWLIQLTTLNLSLQHEFFIRLGPLLLGGLNLILMYRITASIAGRMAGFISSLLFMGSVYGSLIAGVFIMPDSAMLTFWLLFTSVFLNGVRTKTYSTRFWIAVGSFAGLAFISKFHSAFLWFGICIFFLLFYRKIFLHKGIYVGSLVFLIVTLPVILWNVENDFISFTFQLNRVDPGAGGFNIKTFLTEILGALMYNGPINGVLIWITIVKLFSRKHVMNFYLDTALLSLTIPLILFLITSALTKATLPHWSAPAYTLLIVPTAVWLARYKHGVRISAISASITLFLLCIAPSVITNVTFDKVNKAPQRLGRFDFTLDLYGWKQIAQVGKKYMDDERVNEMLKSDSRLVILKWFPGAHIDHYLAQHWNMEVQPIGDLDALHKYDWIRKEISPPNLEVNHYFVTTSHFYQDPFTRDFFSEIKLIAAFPVLKKNHIVENVFLYRVKLNDNE